MQIIYAMFQQIVRGLGKNKIYSENSILLALTNVLLAILFIRVFRLGVSGYISAFCISHALATFYLIIRSGGFRLFSFHFYNASKVRRMMKYSLPMIVNNISWWILNASDKLILNIYCGLNANGIYAAAGKIPGLITTMYGIFHMAWQESTSREKENLSEFYVRVFRNVYAIMSYVLIVLLCLQHYLFKFLINEKFIEAYYHIPILLVGMFFYSLAQYYGGIYIGLMKSKELGYTSAMAAMTNFIVNILLVSKIKIFAASISTLLAYFILCMIRAYTIRKIFRMKYNFTNIGISICIVVATLIGVYLEKDIALMVLLLISTVIYYILYRDIINNLRVGIMRKLHINLEFS